MIDYVGRDVPKARVQTRCKGTATLTDKVRFVALAFPVVFTTIFILNLVLEYASKVH